MKSSRVSVEQYKRKLCKMLIILTLVKILKDRQLHLRYQEFRVQCDCPINMKFYNRQNYAQLEHKPYTAPGLLQHPNQKACCILEQNVKTLDCYDSIIVI